MLQCWRGDPIDRPTFEDLEFKIHEMLYGAGIEGKYRKLVASPANKGKGGDKNRYYNAKKDKKGKKT